LRSEIPALMEARAKRLSDEASALPPTHFLFLLILTLLSLAGFTAATLTITDADGKPPLESRMVFAGLTAVYVLFFNFCKDMNDPFDGVYQIKRSSAASYLLQIKWLIANQPFGADIRFDTRGLAPVYDGNEVIEIGKETRKVDAPMSSAGVEGEPSKKPLVETNNHIPHATSVSEAKKEVINPQLAAVATSIETSAPGVSITTDIPKAPQAVKVANTKVPSVKKFVPERKKKSSATDNDVQAQQSKTTQDEMVSQFESLSGFSGDALEGGGVTVPAKTVQRQQSVDRQKILMNFRKTGGFGG